MPTYTYAIQISGGGGETWMAENDAGVGTKEFDGPADQFARAVLGNRLDDLVDEPYTPDMPIRVIVWDGDHQDVASMAVAIAAPADVVSEDLDAAIGRYRHADRGLIAAMRRADTYGVSRNEIARRVRGICSRQTVLDILGAAELRDRAAAAIDAAGLGKDEEVRLWQENVRTGAARRGWIPPPQEQGDSPGGRYLYLMFADAAGTVADLNAAGGILDALGQAGIAAWDPGSGSSLNMQDWLGNGHLVQLGRRTP
jgi:hypothetical protein